MAGIVRDVLAHRQDVQLHLHPVWLYFKYPQWCDDLTRLPSQRDVFTDRDSDEIADWLRDGADILERLSGSRPTAFRSGNLNTGLVLYQGMRRAGIELASNIGVGLSEPVEHELLLYSGLHAIEGVTEVPVTEVPVTTYRMPLPGSDRLLLLTATGSAFAEMRAVLDAAYRLSASPIVVLMHPQDFRIAVAKTPEAPPDYRPDPVRQSRLERLCGYLADHPERFRVTTFAESAKRWQAARSNRNRLPPRSWQPLGREQTTAPHPPVAPVAGVNHSH
jgi:peptidoglycan/xylan/chitin deacetylase (PgdA/CDA1 family)